MKVNGLSNVLHTMNYDNASGNIIEKTGVGKYTYHNQKIHAVTKVTNPDNIISTNTQDITYTAYHQPQTIRENDIQLAYGYGPDHERKIMLTTQISTNQALAFRFYIGDMEVNGTLSDPKYVHYINSPAGLAAIVTEENNVRNTYTTYTDHLGSIVKATLANGNVVAEQNFDGWGRRRNPSDWTYSPPSQGGSGGVWNLPWWLYRGYTGHEHLDEFGLINMNGRMYDPVLGRMLSADNYVADNTSTQAYNRYTYANNNPMKFVDPNGEFVQYIMGAVFGGIVGAMSGHASGLRGWDLFGYSMLNAGIGALTAGIGGGGISQSISGALPKTLSPFMSGAVSNAISGAATGFAGGLFGSLSGTIFGLNTNPIKSSFSGLGIGAATGFITGGISGEMQQYINKQNYENSWGSIACDICGDYTTAHLPLFTKTASRIGHFLEFGAGGSYIGGFGFALGAVWNDDDLEFYLNIEGRIGFGVGVGFKGGQITPTHNGGFVPNRFNGLSSTYEGGVQTPLMGGGGSMGGSIDPNYFADMGLKNTHRMNPSTFGKGQYGYTTRGVSVGPSGNIEIGFWNSISKTWTFKFW